MGLQIPEMDLGTAFNYFFVDMVTSLLNICRLKDGKNLCHLVVNIRYIRSLSNVSFYKWIIMFHFMHLFYSLPSRIVIF